MNDNFLIDYYEELKDLYVRLVEDYNNNEKFEQCEQDRLALYAVLEYIEDKKGVIKNV